MKSIGTLLVAFASAGLAAAGCSGRPEAPTKNVLLITLDGARQDHLSAFGYSRRTTPNIDWLAANGVAFRNVVPTGCSTLPSLTSLFTSRGWAGSQIDRRSVLRESNVTLAETFAAAGYDTAGFVASPVLAAETRFGQGFAVYEDFRDVPVRYVTAERPVHAAIRYLQSRDTARPIFLYLHLEEPHPPWRQDSPWLDGEERSQSFFGEGCTYVPTADELAQLDDRTKANLVAKYDGALRYADEQIGYLLEHLRTSGMLANTAVAVSTDHGLELVDRYSATHGYNPFDEVVRTFLILYDQSTSFVGVAPEQVQARIFDIGPTLMALARVDKPPTAEGVDLLSRGAVVPEYAFTKCYNADIVRTLDYKLINVDFSRARRNGDHLPVGLREGRHLYALRTDPGEKNDIAGRNPRIEAAMENARVTRGSAQPEPKPADGSQPVTMDPIVEERLRVLGYE